MKQLLAVLSFLPFFCIAQKPNVANGNIVRLNEFGSNYVVARNIDVWLPANYDGKKKFAVLYMHDGQMLFDSSINWNKQEWGVDETASKLMKEKKVKEFIVVGIWNNGKLRHSEYFPQKPFYLLDKHLQDSIYTSESNLFPRKIQSDNYLKFITKELKPYIDKNFSTLKDKANTSIMGSSMGGLISLYAICEYPNVFGKAACLSTHWIGTFADKKTNPIPNVFVSYLKKHLPDPITHKIYFDYGTATLDQYYEPSQLLVDEVMKQKGFSRNNWITKKFEGEDHSENAWNKRLFIPLLFLFGK